MTITHFQSTVSAGNDVEPQLSDLTDPLSFSNGPSPSNVPRVGLQFQTDGDLTEATGDDGSPLSFSKVGEWLSNLVGIDSSEWEVKADITSTSGAAGTWTGFTDGVYQDLTTEETWIWTKDSTAAGTASTDITITLRNKVDTANSVSRANMSYSATVLV